MKIILLHDVAKIGKKYEVKTVADGYALNALIPKGLAEAATAQALSRLEAKKKREMDEKKVHEALLVKSLGGLSSAKIEIVEKANEKGHLFAQVHTAEIAKALKEQLNFNAHPEHIMLEKPIKEVGESKVTIQINDKKATVTVIVKAK
jgi:large subunit ribosomal protein L9